MINVVSHQTRRKHVEGVCEQSVEVWDLKDRQENRKVQKNWLMTELLTLLCNNSYYRVKVRKYDFL